MKKRNRPRWSRYFPKHPRAPQTKACAADDTCSMKRQLHTRWKWVAWTRLHGCETVNPKPSQPCMPKPQSPILDPRTKSDEPCPHTTKAQLTHGMPSPPGCLCRDTRSSRWPSNVHKYGPFPSPLPWRPAAMSSSKPSPRFSNLAKMLGCRLVCHLAQGVLVTHYLPLRYHLPACLVSSLPRSLLVAAKAPGSGRRVVRALCFL